MKPLLTSSGVANTSIRNALVFDGPADVLDDSRPARKRKLQCRSKAVPFPPVKLTYAKRWQMKLAVKTIEIRVSCARPR